MPVRCPLRGVPGTCGGESWGASFGTLLGPEATGPYLAAMREGDLVGFLLFPHPSEAAHVCAVPAGVTGLLFENYIVDASILKQFFDEPGLASPFGVSLFRWFSREALFDLCGQVFKSTRWM